MAKYDIRIKRSAVKELKNFPAADIQRILAVIVALADEPRPAGNQNFPSWSITVSAAAFTGLCMRFRILFCWS